MRRAHEVTRPADRHRAAPAVLAAMVALTALPGGTVAQDAEHPGKPVYDRWCAACHGVDGDGQGASAAWMLPRPRDFTGALYQIRTTPSGALPTDADILKVIDEGMPGTAMPGWESHLSRADRDALVGYLKTFSRFFEMEDAPPPIEVSGAPGMSEEAIADGRRLYDEIECWKCHGEVGRGDGASAPTQTDDAGHPIRPADLSENWLFNGGGSVEAIYTRLRTGLDGTPMPSFSDLVDGGVITDEELWHLAMYVRSLSPEEEPEVRDVIRAALVDGALPSSLDDEAWAAAERSYIPLVGQIIVEPRWFAPTVDGVWVEALHDGEEVVLRLTWNDPSESPDPRWADWQALVASHVEPAPDAEGSAPDALAIQFPATLPDGRELPFFLGGDGREPVYLWRWQSDRDGIEEALGRGLDQVEALPAVEAAPVASAAFDRGQWRLMVRRALVSGDPERRTTMADGTAIPIAFFARDGSNGETGTRGSVSSWYYLWLDRPVPMTVYAVPIAAAVLTALLGLLVVSRAQRAERERPRTETETLLEGA
jgi:DMSO reductase family type II enzyme heme b subunit